MLNGNRAEVSLGIEVERRVLVKIACLNNERSAKLDRRGLRKHCVPARLHKLCARNQRAPFVPGDGKRTGGRFFGQDIPNARIALDRETGGAQGAWL